MKCLAVVCGLTLVLSGVVHGQSPIRDAAARVVAPEVSAPALVRQNPELYWGGNVVAAIGGGMLGWGLGMGDATVACTAGRTVICTETNGNRALWIGGGAALAAAGIAMAAIGGKRVLPAVTFRPHGLAVTHRLQF